MAGWHHGLDGRESESTPRDGDEQGGLECCDSWGRKESDTTEVTTLGYICASLEKTLESPLDCKEIQPDHSEGDQP